MSVPKLWSLHHILLLSVFTGAANGYYNYYWSQCIYSSSDFSDMVFLIDYYFNKYLYVQFNSTVGEFVGFTEVGVRTAENLNKDTALLQQLKAEVERVCKHNAVLYKTAIHDKLVLNIFLLYKGKYLAKIKHILKWCIAYNGNIYIVRYNCLVTSDVTFTEKMPNRDWYHQIHTKLEYTPKAAEKISCMVEHAGFTKPMIYDWMEYTAVIHCWSCWIIIAAAGFIYYKSKTTGL
uniref:Si:ch73-158p21.3 n=1 Tax=Sinocyclocheilus grahami TaxID=75366 RepID=A0A672L1X9_SINGR